MSCSRWRYWSLEQAKLGKRSPARLAGRIALVTGAGGAIGHGICAELLAQGCHVFATDLDEARLASVVEKLIDAHGEPRVGSAVMDVTEADSVAEAFRACVLRFGGLDVLVPNAGVAVVATLVDMDEAAFRRVVEVNLTGTMLVLREGARVFRAQRSGGAVVLQGSKNVAAPGAGFGAYSASKAGATQLARVAALELAPLGVRVNTVHADAVFGDDVPSGLWEEVGPQRMKARGLDPAGLREYLPPAESAEGRGHASPRRARRGVLRRVRDADDRRGAARRRRRAGGVPALTMASSTTTSAPPIEVRGLRKVYRTRGRPEVVAVDGLDLRVETGQVFGLLGPNGAGKTTTVEICEGLLTQTEGDVHVLGMAWDHEGQQIRERIGVSLQDTRMFDKLTVRELLLLFTCSYSKRRPVADLLELVGLNEKADARYEHLSGGQKQRLAVATALGGSPELLFLDEPTTGLDPQSRRRLWDVVREFRHDAGGTVLLTTHYMDEAEVLCDRIMIVDHGKCIAFGTPKQLIASLGAGHVVEVEAAHLNERLGDPSVVANMPGVVEQELQADRLTMTIEAPHIVLPPLLRLLDERGIEPSGIATRHTSLEDVFVHLTGRHLRDGAGKP